MEFPDHLQSLLSRFESFLDSSVPAPEMEPEPIYRAMRYSLFAGGKRLRPLICLTAAESLSGKAETIFPLAAAIEKIHTYSLIHDDLPSMDNDDYRRGKPTNHKVFGEAIAILAGDALLTSAFHEIAAGGYSAETTVKLIRLLSEAAGPGGMIGGQVLDMIKEASLQPSEQEVERIHSMKTAALIRFSAVSAAVVCSAEKKVESAFAEYGGSIGLAFQIVDDVLDLEGTSEQLGKTAGKDASMNKVTYPSLFGLESSKRLAKELVERACRSIVNYDREGYLQWIAKHVLERNR